MTKRVALFALVAAACSRGATHSGFQTSDFEGGVATFPDGGGGDGTVGPAASSSGGGSGDAAPEASGPAAHVRFADWTPDGPGAGFSYCLAPIGVATWMGPFLPKGLQFPGTSAYVDVPPGSYQVQVITGSSGDCTVGVIPASTGLPLLSDGTYATIATIGDVTPVYTDPAMRVVAFVDDTTGLSAKLKLRAIDAAPSFRYAEIGTGQPGTGNFTPLFPDVAFGATANTTAGGATLDGNDYAQLDPLSATELIVKPLGGDPSDSPTATQVSLPAGSVATLVIVGAKTGGSAAQIVICNDVAAAGGAASPCTMYGQ